MRYNWEGEEPWVKFKATDADGVVYRYEEMPDRAVYSWQPKEGTRYDRDEQDCPDWVDSLEARPEPAKEAPAVEHAPAVKYDPAKCKPFDLARALAGDPVCTVEGLPVTQLVRFETLDDFTLYGVCDDTVLPWRADGTCGVSSHDLRMAPKKRTVWRNSYAMELVYGLVAVHRDFESEDSALNDATAFPRKEKAVAVAVPVEIEG